MFEDSATVMPLLFFNLKQRRRLDSSAASGAASSSSNGSNTTFSHSILELNLDEDSDEDVVEKEDPIHVLFSDSDSETNQLSIDSYF